MKTIEEKLEEGGPEAANIIARSLNILNKIRKVQSHALGAGPIKVLDAGPIAPTDQVKAASYAETINQIGAKMRGRSCREPLPIEAAIPWPTQTMDAAGEPEDFVSHYEATRAYAEQCRKLHRTAIKPDSLGPLGK
jgi:hypothetical protein